MMARDQGFFALRLFTLGAFACFAAFCIGMEYGRIDRDAKQFKAECDLAGERGARRAWESEAERYRTNWLEERRRRELLALDMRELQRRAALRAAEPELEVVTEGE